MIIERVEEILQDCTDEEKAKLLPLIGVFISSRLIKILIEELEELKELEVL